MLIRSFFMWLFIMTACFQPSIAFAAETIQKPLFVVLIPGLNLDDLSHYKSLSWLSNNSAIGLMNTATPGGKKLASAYLSLSAGAKTACTEKEGGLIFQNTENINGLNISMLYQRYLNKSADGYDILMPTIQNLLNAGINDSRLKLIGDILEFYDIAAIFIGNQDVPGNISRPSALMALSSSGRIQNGFVDERTYKISTYSATYFTTNYTFYYMETQNFLKRKDGLVILDLGDLARLDSLAPQLSDEVYLRNRDQLLKEMDDFIGSLIQLIISAKGQLLIATPYPDKYSLETGNTLTPVFYYNSSSSGLLSSASTKRPGLITNIDIAPTIFALSGLEPQPAYIGAPIYTVAEDDPLAVLKKNFALIRLNFEQRPLILKGYVLLQIIIVLSAIVLILLRHKLLYHSGPYLLFLTTGPLLFLLLPLFPVSNLYARAVIVITMGILIVILLELKITAIQRLAFLYLFTAIIITADLLTGASLMKTSLLGYDAISGARYYGLGNEYMGVLLGSSLIGSSLLLETLTPYYPRLSGKIAVVAIVVLAALTIVVAAPQWGTNVGGFISFTASLVLLTFFVKRKKIDLKTIGYAGLGCSAVVALLFYLDLQRPAAVQSHIGLTARLIDEQGILSLWPIIVRKLNMNIKLLQYSLWTRVFLTFLAATALMFYKPRGVLKKLFFAYPYLKAGFIAGLSGSFIALIVNDSGIVAAATSSIFIVPTLLYLIAERVIE